MTEITQPQERAESERKKKEVFYVASWIIRVKRSSMAVQDVSSACASVSESFSDVP
jgi:hypothetical protein